MGTISISSTTSAISTEQVQNAFRNLEHKTAFKQFTDYIRKHTDQNIGVIVLSVGDDATAEEKEAHVLTDLDPPYDIYDQVVYIPIESFDGDTYTSMAGSRDFSLERLFAHEFFHVMDNMAGATTPNEAGAMSFSNQIMADRDYGEAWQNATPGIQDDGADPLSRVHNSLSGDVRELLEELYPLLPLTTSNFPPKSPLVIDADFSGTIELSTLGDTATFFDLDGNGQAELTAWITDGDGLLAIDANNDGQIGNINELFGASGGLEDGFAALRDIDSDNNSIVNSSDADWDELLVWIDSDMDGVSRAEELFTLDALQITAIYLDAALERDLEIAGNQITHTSRFVTSNNDVFSIVDAWFATNPAITRNNEDFDLLPETLLLPNLRGFGEIKDLYIAASIDCGPTNTVLSKLDGLHSSLMGYGSVAEVFEDWAAIASAVDDLLLRWADVDSVTPGTRGPHVDAQHLAFYEAFIGQPFIQYDQANPLVEAGAFIEAFYEYIKTYLTSQLVGQVIGVDLFVEPPVYELSASRITGDMELTQAAIDDVESVAIGATDPTEVWAQFAQFIGYTKGLASLTIGEISALDTAVANTAEPGISDWADVVTEMVLRFGNIIDSSDDWSGFEVFYDHQTNGTNSGETLTGHATESDHIEGRDGNDVIYGLGGSDRLEGGAGSDTLYGGAGDDYLVGGTDSDIYVYDGGNDTVQDEGGSFDEIHVASSTGFYATDIFEMYRNGDDFTVIFDGGSFITIDNYFDGDEIEQIKFLLDNSIVDLTSLASLETFGGSANDAIEGIDPGAGDVDIIHGGGGNDNIVGHDGNDVLYGDGGADDLTGNAGDDILDGGDGDDILWGDADNLELGNDTFIASNGHDWIRDEGGTDVIDFGSVSSGALTIYRSGGSAVGDHDVKIEWSDNSISAVDGEIERIVFNSDPDIDLTTFQFTTYGSDEELVPHFGWNNMAYEEIHGIVEANTNHDDIIYALGGRDIVLAFDGDDFVDGGAGDDLIEGGEGIDELLGGDGDDTIHGGDDNDDISGGIGDDILNGDDGNDVLVGGDGDDIFSGSIGNDTIDGGSDIDTLDYYSAAAGVNVNLQTGIVSDDGDGGADTVSNIEVLFGSQYADVLTGANAGSTIFGDHGNDTISGGSGDDILTGGLGNDTIDGGSGTDQANYLGAAAGIVLNLQTGVVSNDGDGGTDTLSNIEDVTGSEYADTIAGSTADNYIIGHFGNDTLNGGAGNDTYDYWPGEGNDTIYDTAGNDEIVLGDGIVENDISFDRNGDDLEITIDTAVLTVVDHFVAGGAYTVESLVLFDSTVIDLTDFIINGTSGADTLIGTAYSDVIAGGAGNDTIAGGPGDDSIDGGADTDTLTYALAASGIVISLASGSASVDGDGGSDTFSNIENVTGSAFADTIVGSSGANVISSGNGNDSINAGAGNDTIDGGQGIDSASYASAGSAVTVSLLTGTASGGDGNDTLANIENLTGSAYGDTITGSSGANILIGGAGNDSLSGDAGNDIISGGAGNDTIDGGSGTGDTVDYSAAAAGVTVSLASGTASNDGDGGSDTISNIENVIGSAYADTITGSSSINNLNGGAGNDTITGGNGNDILVGGAGNDSITGGGNTDTVDYSAAASGVTVSLQSGTASNDGDGGSDTIATVEGVNGSAYADSITGDGNANTLAGRGGNDTIDGGGGTDTVDYSASVSGVVVSLAAGTASNDGHGGSDTISNTENITGSAFNDTLTGNTAANVLHGGSAGSDILRGGAGNDALNGGTGVGVDIADYSAAAAAVTVNIGSNSASNDGDGGSDTFTSIEGVYGSAYNDSLTGSSGDDTIRGGIGNDTIDGSGGYDTLDFGAAAGAVTANTITSSVSNDGDGGTDTITGMESIIGSANADTLTASYYVYGGAGNDTITSNVFAYGEEGNDTITINGTGSVYGGAGDDTVTVGSGSYSVTIYGDEGDDSYNGSASTSIVFVRYYDFAVAAIVADLDAGTIISGTDTDAVVGITGITATSYDDEIYGDSVREFLNGVDGNDLIYGYGGDDDLTGGAGDDTIYGGDGVDSIVGGSQGADLEGENILSGGAGEDFIFANGGDDTIDGGSDTDTLTYVRSAAAVSVNMLAGTVDEGIDSTVNDTFTAIEKITGSNFSDVIIGNAINGQLEGGDGNDLIYGGDGNDGELRGQNGNDSIYGGDGNDTLFGGNNDDILYGDAGSDTLRGESGNDIVVYSAGLDTVYETGGTDTLLMTGGVTVNDISIANASTYDAKITVTASVDEVTVIDLRHGTSTRHVERIAFDDGFSTSLTTYASWLKGTSGSDLVAGDGSDNTLIGYAGTDTITGGNGNDDAHGGAGNDSLDGGDGTDLLYGGTGDDTLYGKAGLDTLHGGAGADTFVFETASAFSNVDVIRDFSTADGDILNLVDILGVTYDPLTEVISDFVSKSESGGSTFISVDRDGTAGVYSMAQVIKLENVTGMASIATLETNGNLIAA